MSEINTVPLPAITQLKNRSYVTSPHRRYLHRTYINYWGAIFFVSRSSSVFDLFNARRTKTKTVYDPKGGDQRKNNEPPKKYSFVVFVLPVNLLRTCIVFIYVYTYILPNNKYRDRRRSIATIIGRTSFVHTIYGCFILSFRVVSFRTISFVPFFVPAIRNARNYDIISETSVATRPYHPRAYKCCAREEKRGTYNGKSQKAELDTRRLWRTRREKNDNRRRRRRNKRLGGKITSANFSIRDSACTYGNECGENGWWRRRVFILNLYTRRRNRY